MKKSYYNFLITQEDGTGILYNSRTGAMAVLDAEHRKQYIECSEEELEQQNPLFANALLGNGFAIEDDLSELDMIKYDSLRVKFGSRSMSLTIAPTQDCNFGCIYCYEKERLSESYMDNETRAALVDYVKGNVIVGEKLQVCWYGGEPLMAMEIITELSEQFLDLCGEKNVEYQAMVITNGYLLNEMIVQKLIKCKIHIIQITLDGNRDTHNARRHLKGGESTYDEIWENILALRKFRNVLEVHLRVNVDKENSSAVEEIRKRVEQVGMEDFVFVYPGKVVDHNNCYKQNTCFNNRDFAILEQEYFSGNEKYLRTQYPRPRHNVCGADVERSVVINEDGYMYKCWMDLGDKNCSIGNVKIDSSSNEKKLYQYILYDITQDEGCKKCKYLPLCLGGCPWQRVRGEKDCTLRKYNLEQYIKLLPRVMKETD